MTLAFNTKYLNRTENKSARPPSKVYRAILWHETQNSSGNAQNTLRWNLYSKDPKTGKPIESSYDFLIGRDGTIWQYLDYHQYISWDAGVAEWTIDGTFYRNWELNSITLGVELDGPCDGTPVTLNQIEAAAELAIFLNETEGIPLDRAHQLTHAEVARKRTINKRTDPRGYTPEQILEKVKEMRAPDWAKEWGPHFPYFADSGIAQRWRQEHATQPLGEAVTDEYEDRLGRVCRNFTSGAIWFWNGTSGVWR